MNASQKWLAVLNNDKDCDGKFYYAVKSTHIFCRPSCNSKPPLKENVVFFETATAAIDAGYRPCKRCRPDLLNYQPVLDFAAKVKETIDGLFTDKAALSKELASLGVSRRHMTEIFMNQYGQTPNEYVRSRRLTSAKAQLADGNDSVLDIALSLGFNGASAFYTFFHKHVGMSPGEYRSLGKANTGGSYFAYNLVLGKVAIATAGGSITAIQFADCLEKHGGAAKQ